MTVTEPAALPEWEASLHRSGYVPQAEEESARDPDYLVARLRRATGRAAAAVSATRAEDERHSKAVADATELPLLRMYVDDLIGELRIYTRAGDDMLAALRGACPDLEWQRSGGVFFGFYFQSYGRPTKQGTAARYAAQLGLREEERSGVSRSWKGILESWHIRVADL